MNIIENTYTGTFISNDTVTVPINTAPANPVEYTSDTRNREKIRPVKPVLKTLTCPIDGCDGEMKAGGMVLTSNPPFYQHFCTKCGHTEYVHGKTYPYYDFIPVEDNK